jgi:broad specificity phosphatase PhoE/predicted kinase
MASSSFATTENKVILAAASCSLLAGLLYIRNRPRGDVKDTKTNKFYSGPVNNSLVNLNQVAKVASNDESVDPHPEGPNIGFRSNASWFNRFQTPAKIDLLHKGHTAGGKLIVVMVGLPGRGKTYIARKVARYLRWISYRTRAFSLAKYRLDRMGSKSADYFDPSSQQYYQQRVNLMMEALEDSLRYLERGGEIAIIDGTNTAKHRRQLIRDRVAKEPGYEVLWIESISEENSFNMQVLRNSPDFLDMDDYRKKLEYYKANYEELSDDEGAFAKVYNGGKKITLHGIHGFLPTKIVSFVMNIHPDSKRVYLVRHGESEFNTMGLVGGDCGLTDRGLAFSKALGEYVSILESDEAKRTDTSTLPGETDGSWSPRAANCGPTAKKLLRKSKSSRESLDGVNDDAGNGTTPLTRASSNSGGSSDGSQWQRERFAPQRGKSFYFTGCRDTYKDESNAKIDPNSAVSVWTSSLRRARETAEEIPCKQLVEWRSLREIEVGVCDGLTYEQVKETFPQEYAARDKDKLTYRYPRGESYLDVIVRLEPVIYELERQRDPVVIVAHQASVRCLYAYFLDLPAEEIPYLSFPLHTLFKLEPHAFGCKEKRLRIVTSLDDPQEQEQEQEQQKSR